MIGDDDCGEIGGIKIGMGTEVLGENLPQRHFVHHKSHVTTRVWTRAAAVGSQRLTAWAMARHFISIYSSVLVSLLPFGRQSIFDWLIDYFSRLWFYALWRRVVLWVFTYVSDKP
jgi:hypothetical protein